MKNFEFWPAIDVMEGSPVRLYKGDYAQKTDYGAQFDLENLAKIFSDFAHGIHFVDLDGARQKKVINFDAIAKVVSSATIPVEVGGGIRTPEEVEKLFSLGVSRVILGTSALQNPAFLHQMLEKFGPKKIVVGVDVKDDLVAIHGWEETSAITTENFLSEMQNIGIETIIFTDISTDGTLAGPPIETLKSLCAVFPSLSIIASGGISCNADVFEIQKTGAKGAIFGKAFYENHLDISLLKKTLLSSF